MIEAIKQNKSGVSEQKREQGSLTRQFNYLKQLYKQRKAGDGNRIDGKFRTNPNNDVY